DLHRWNADAHRHVLAFLAADTYTLVKLQVVADHADVLQRLGSVADERSALHGPRELAVLDQVTLGSLEYEIPAGDVDLASAERRAVDAFRHAADDLLRIALPREHVGVGHARHGDVLVALAPAAAGGSRFRQPARKLVGEIPAQNAVLDQDVLP